MARLNTAEKTARTGYTHEGAKTIKSSPEKELRRAVLCCMLWEDTFYESGEDIGSRIQRLAAQCSPEFIAKLTDEARNIYRIRHASLWLAVGALKGGGKHAEETLFNAIQRPDEITESLAMYWKSNPRGNTAKVPRAWMRAVSRCFLEKFDEYQLSKYNKTDNEITLKDAYFLAHPMAYAKRHTKGLSQKKENLFKRLVEDKLQVADTWENKLSAGSGKTTKEQKSQSFEDLLKRNKMGGMAVLRNLRNMREAGVDKKLVAERLIGGAHKNPSLPFRYLAAAQQVPQWEDIIDQAMLASFEGNKMMPQFEGNTVVLVDVSASMNAKLSAKSIMRRADAAASLAIFAREASADCRVFHFGTRCAEVPARRGMALRDAVCQNNGIGHGTMINLAVDYVNKNVKSYDRLILITDMQTSAYDSKFPKPKGKGYMLNVAPYENAIGFGHFMHIDGWSEQVVRFVAESESVL